MRVGQVVGYVRVSTVDQNIGRQLEGVACDETFVDRASGSTIERPALQEMLRYVRRGDMVVVHSIDRLARNLDDLRGIVADLGARDIGIRFIKEGLTFSSSTPDAMCALMLSMLGAFAEFERALMRERQREGIAVAKSRGVYTGRKPRLPPDRRADLLEAIRIGAESKAQIARTFGISKSTLYDYIREAKPL